MVPYKFSVDSGNAEYIDIKVNWTVSNSNDVGLWADMGLKLVHQRGARTPFLTTAYDEVWCMYVPGMGMVIDYAQNLFPPELESGQSGDMLLAITGLLMGSFGGETRYNHPDTDHRVNPNVYSTFVGRPILVPPRSNARFYTTLTIPGPGASEGMADFWDKYGSPDFDLQVSVIEVVWPYPDKPPEGETGPTIAKKRINNALELRMDEEADLRPKETFEPAPFYEPPVFEFAPFYEPPVVDVESTFQETYEYFEGLDVFGDAETVTDKDWWDEG